ncbi:MAG: Spy/CpxP family protein refolding chaperone [Phormidesmis sp. CAN_BIN36]|nr:Spy/CpxP family protein refolding chaperone [Phormidesmis sp. CAN_BIN36]
MMNNHPSRLLKFLTLRRVSAIVALLMALGGAIALKESHRVDATLEPSFLAADPGAQDALLPPKRGMGWLRELDLEPAQMQKIQAIRRQSRDQIDRQRQAIQQGQQELRSLMASDASADQIRGKYLQVKRVREELADTQFNSLLEMRQVLTPNQRRKFAERMQRRRDANDRVPRS